MVREPSKVRIYQGKQLVLSAAATFAPSVQEKRNISRFLQHTNILRCAAWYHIRELGGVFPHRTLSPARLNSLVQRSKQGVNYEAINLCSRFASHSGVFSS